MRGAHAVFASAREKKRRLARVSSDLWNTPQALLKSVRRVGPIELDVATSDRNPVGAERFYAEKNDGLAQRWDVSSEGVAWMNPPYSQCGVWLEKIAQPWIGSRIALVPARTETLAWHRYVWPKAQRVCFLKGRLVFDVPPCKGGHKWREAIVLVKRKRVRKKLCKTCNVEKPTSAPFPSALILFSNVEEMLWRFDEVFADAGKVIEL